AAVVERPDPLVVLPRGARGVDLDGDVGAALDAAAAQVGILDGRELAGRARILARRALRVAGGSRPALRLHLEHPIMETAGDRNSRGQGAREATRESYPP